MQNEFDLFLRLALGLLKIEPQCDFGIYSIGRNESFFEFSSSSPITINEDVLKMLGNIPLIGYKFTFDEKSLFEYYSDLDRKNQKLKFGILNQYLLKGINSFDDKNTYDFVSEFFTNEERVEHEEFVSIYMKINEVRHLLQQVFEANEKSIKHFYLSFESDYKNYDFKSKIEADKASLNFTVFITDLFLCLNALIENICQLNPNNQLILGQIASKIPFTPYNRDKRNRIVAVNSIYEMIAHFRDAHAHKERKSINIHKKSDGAFGGGFRVCPDDIMMTIGEYEISFKKQIQPLIIGLNLKFKKQKIGVLSIIDIETGNTIFEEISEDYSDHLTVWKSTRDFADRYDFDINMEYFADRGIHRVNFKINSYHKFFEGF